MMILAAMALATSSSPAVKTIAASVRVVEQQAVLTGVWDLTWQTDKGPVRKGYMDIVQSGQDIDLTIHGNSEIKARGTTDGRTFTVRGSRFFISYLLTGNIVAMP